jgi:hypothetical protein
MGSLKKFILGSAYASPNIIFFKDPIYFRNTPLSVYITNNIHIHCKADHGIVFAEFPIRATRNKPVRRRRYKWKRADRNKMREEPNTFAFTFTTNFSITSSIEDMWRAINSSLSLTLDKCVPSKMTTSRSNQTWINREIK